MLTTSDWNKRFHQQAGWTQSLRRYVYDQANLRNARRVLEVGSGTGVLLAELGQISQADIYGLDINQERLEYSRPLAPEARLVQGNGLWLPFSQDAFDLVICHYLLLWVWNPLQVVKEMVRVARPGGVICALAEPDYGGRIDFPPELSRLGELQRLSLQEQGADPEMGRKIKGILTAAGVKNVESGVLNAQWSTPASREDRELEWAVLHSDLQGRLSEPELARLQAIDRQAWQAGQRVLYIPTFFAWGRKGAIQ